MKNIIALILFIIAVTLFVSCGGGDEITADVSPEELMEAVITAYNAEDVPEALLFLSESGEEQDEYLDPDRAGYFFYSEYGYDMADLYGMSSFALRIPTGNKVFEVCILLTNEPSELDSAKELLRARLVCKSGGDIANYMPEEQRFLDAAEIFTIGNYAFLIATVDNDIARDAIKAKLAV